jgi:uncharacterized membrane protein (DUF4010 family)
LQEFSLPTPLGSADTADLFYRFGIALVIGVLIGLEREFVALRTGQNTFAGIRTMALISLAGCTGALLADLLDSPWPLVAVLTMTSALILTGYVSQSRAGDIGGTSEIAATIVLLTGAVCYYGLYALAAAIAVTTTVLLSLKGTLHGFAQRLSSADIYATLKFAVISAIVLPVLPNQSFGPPPLDALNPYRIWLMVVLISGISFSGYVLIKFAKTRRGLGLTGLLGGMVSSTAVTFSYTERSRREPALATPYALAITLAWSVLYGRVMVLVGLLNVGLLGRLWLPLTVTGVAVLGYGVYLMRQPDSVSHEDVELVNPFELRPTLTFGAIYAVTLMLVRAGEVFWGNAGLYVSSVVSGLASVDAIVLSMAELDTRGNGVTAGLAANAILLAVFSNTVVKGALVLISGSRAMRRAMWPTIALGLVVLAATALLV